MRRKSNYERKHGFEVKKEQFQTSRWTSGIIAFCVKVARTENGVAVADTKGGPTLFFNENEWAAFIRGAKEGAFDVQDNLG